MFFVKKCNIYEKLLLTVQTTSHVFTGKRVLGEN